MMKNPTTAMGVSKDEKRFIHFEACAKPTWTEMILPRQQLELLEYILHATRVHEQC